MRVARKIRRSMVLLLNPCQALMILVEGEFDRGSDGEGLTTLFFRARDEANRAAQTYGARQITCT